MKLSVTLAVYNEEKFLGKCLDSVKDIADEIVVVDGTSTDNTVAIAKKYSAKIIVRENPKNFHINKQKALEASTGEWILQLDADEIVSPNLALEIKRIISMTQGQIEEHEKKLLKRKSLFIRHQRAVEVRDGKIGSENGNYTTFFIPRLNFFLGRFLKHGGIYPDGVIRLFRNGNAKFPCISVHEQISIKGRVGWLQNDLLHYADKTFENYLTRFDRYTDLERLAISGGFLTNIFIKPLFDKNQGFLFLYFRHKGFLDGFPGFVWALFSALHFPIAYFKSLDKKHESKIN